MSNKTEPLITLIRSLSRSEKRYFSLFAARHTIGRENMSVRLFHKLEGLKSYDEKKFLARHRREEFARNYRFNKHFLYRLILEALRAFHTGKSAESEIREQVIYAEILTEKGLFTEALAIIQAAKAKARRYEMLELLLQLLRKELNLYREQSLTVISEEAIDALFREFHAVLQELGGVLEYEAVTARISQRISKAGFARSKQSLDELFGMNVHAALEDPPPQFTAAWSFYNSRVAIGFMQQDFERALAETDALIRLIEAHPHMSAEMPKAYISILHNKIVLLNNLNRYSDVANVAEKIDCIPVRTQVLKNRKFYSSHNLLLSMYPKTGEFEKGLALLNKMEEKLESGEVQFLNPIHRLTHCFSAANIHFSAGNYPASNKYLQDIISWGDESPRSDIVAYARIMRMIVQFEMGKQDLLEYTVRSVYRFLYKRKRIYKFEDILLRFIRRKAPVLDSPRETIEAFRELHNELQPLTADRFERTAFAYFDILSWLESKISNVPFASVVQAKARAQA
jgi:hypothetical protein